MANAFERCGMPFRSVSGYLADERAWARIGALGQGRRACAARCGTAATA